jgi:hypothetical protein
MAAENPAALSLKSDVGGLKCLQSERGPYMSGLFVIFSARQQKQLSQRRNGYLECRTSAGWAYVREEANSAHLGRRTAGQVALSGQFTEDATSVGDDPTASVFFIDIRHRETVEAAIERGLQLPLGRSGMRALVIDEERRTVAGL